ncbi:MAG: hypothetical protein MMC33_001739 [Icmadophila ericetorum]|nr:hypothetical protein [Icmadophila ericetorum]
MTANYSVYSIPIFFLLSLLPHSYAIYIINSHTSGKGFDNTSPRSTSSLTHLQKTLPPKAFKQYERAEGAHKNGFENLPIFMAAVTLGNMAGLGAGVMNVVAGGGVGLRLVYNYLYLYTEDRKKSFLRTGVYLIHVALMMGTIIAAGNRIRDGGV